MAAQIEQQRRLIDLVAALEIPVVTLAEGVLLAPIVGHIDARRAQALMTRLLQEAQSLRARMIVLDIAGVAAVDTSVAQALLNTARALRLLGCEVALSGISATVAATMMSIGVDLADVAIVRGPQEALARVLEQRVGDR
jgi:anti-anti-sigma factor